MNCDLVAKQIPLYYYGELAGEDEDRLEEHVRDCAHCARELESQRRLAAALDRREAEMPAALLEDCRSGLKSALREEALHPAKGPWRLFLDAMAASLTFVGPLRRPAGAMALVAVGFLAARLTSWGPGATPASNPEAYAAVRSVEPAADGQVKIIYDETRRREMFGRAADRNIQKLLMVATREQNPAVRVESVDILKGVAESQDAMEALLNSFSHDPIADVRLKALEGLQTVAHDPRVMGAMVDALTRDDNSLVRLRTLDAVLANRSNSMVGMFQSIVQRENDGYVRSNIEKALRDMNASVGTF
jgi:hypothetical protein